MSFDDDIAKTHMTRKQLAKAYEVLSESQLLSFFKAADRGSDRPTAVMLANKGINAGHALETVLCSNEDVSIPPRYRLNFTLEAERISPDAFRISFGGATSTLGDGATWLVKYDAEGSVYDLVLEDSWHK